MVQRCRVGDLLSDGSVRFCSHSVGVDNAVRDIVVAGASGGEVLYVGDAVGYVTRLEQAWFEPSPATSGQTYVSDSWGGFYENDGTGGCLLPGAPYAYAVSCTDPDATPRIGQPIGGMLPF